MKLSLKKNLKPTIHPIEKFVFFKTHLLFFGIGLLLFFLLHMIAVEFYSFKETAIEDIDFSDLYYQTQDTLETKNNNIIIINSGSLKNDSVYGRRLEMIGLIHKLTDNSYCKPKKIGVDLEYVTIKDTLTDKKLEKLFIKEKCIVAESKQSKTIFKELETYNVNFPDEENKAVRKYYNYCRIKEDSIKNTFANGCLDSLINSKKKEEFHLKYYCKGKGFYNVLDKENEEETVFAFPAIEADTILKGMTKLDMTKFFKDKIVLIGHLGEGERKMNNINDVTDKHKTPTDLEFIFKNKSMPGVIIHANAIKQLQLGHKISCLDGAFYLLLLYFITAYFFLIFLLVERFESVFIQLLLELLILIPSIIFINYLSVFFMGHSWHINTVYLAICFIFMIELKSFYMEFYHEQTKHKSQQNHV